MKIKIRPKHASMLQMNDCRTELGESTRPAGPGARILAGPVGGAAWPSRRDRARADRGYPPLSWVEMEWHHDYLADETIPAGR